MAGDGEAADTLTKADVDQAPLLQRIPRAVWAVAGLAILGGGYFAYTNLIVPSMIRSEVVKTLPDMDAAVAELETCVIGEGEGNWLSAIILRTASEETYPDDLVGCADAFSGAMPKALHDGAAREPDGALGTLVAAATALGKEGEHFRSELASPKEATASAQALCSAVLGVRSALASLAEEAGGEAVTGTPGSCELDLQKVPQAVVPSDILESRPEAVVDRGYRLGKGAVISYRAKGGGDLGILSYAVDGTSWELLSYDKGIHARPLWSKDLAWTVRLPSPSEKIPGKFLAHLDGAWQERADMAPGLLPWRLVGGGETLAIIARPDTSPGADYIVQRSTDAGETLSQPVNMGPPQFSLKPGTRVAEDGTLVIVEADRSDTKLRFLSRGLPPGEGATVQRKELLVDVGKSHNGPDPELQLCIDDKNMWALVGKRWVFGSGDGGKDWRLIHTFEREHAHAGLQCHEQSAVVISNIDQTMRRGTRWTVCREKGCAESALAAVRGVEVSTRLDEGQALLNVEFGDGHFGVLFSDSALAGKPKAVELYEVERPEPDKRLPLFVVNDHAWLMSSLDPGWEH